MMFSYAALLALIVYRKWRNGQWRKRKRIDFAKWFSMMLRSGIGVC